MKSFLAHLAILPFLLFLVLFILFLLSRFLPVNTRPCFGTAKDGHLRWHSLTECAH